MFEEKKRLNWVLSQYGQAPNTFYYDGDMDRIQLYFNHKKDRETQLFFLDDITWNDLDMDEIYKTINNTMTSPGEQLLYYQLRCPASSKEEFVSRKSMIESVESDSIKREKLLRIFARLGKNRTANLIDTFHPSDHTLKFLIPAFLSVLLLFVSIAGVAFSSSFIIPMLFFLVWNPLFHAFMSKRLHADLPIVNYSVSLIAAAKETDELLASNRVLWPGRLQTMVKKASALTNLGTVSAASCSDMGQIVNGFLLVDIITCELLKNRLARLYKEVFIIHEQLGKIDSAIAIASYRRSKEKVCIPQVVFDRKEKPFITAKAVVHPLLARAVENDVSLTRSLLITGSNATGKSTFLKSIIVNTILAQGIITAVCAEFKASSFRMYSSMAIRDNIFAGESYFIAEIKSLKRILDQINSGERILCIIDEVLRGTNTVERIAASSELLSALAAPNVLCAAATHDIEMCDLLGETYHLGHFSEHIADGKIYFDYKYKNGSSKSRNAIQLLKLLGFNDSIVSKANQKAEQFIKSGSWS